MIERTAAIILAAGASTRLGRPKQLVKMAYQGGSETLIYRAARLAGEAGCAPVVPVLGACDQPCRAALDGVPDLRIVHNQAWREGMGTTVRAGILALTTRKPGEAHEAAAGEVDAVLMMVTDQAHLSAPSLIRLLSEHHRRGAPATAAFYGGRPGVPAVFRRELFPALAALDADQGARYVLEQLGTRAATVPMPEAAFDVDTPEDLLALGN